MLRTDLTGNITVIVACPAGTGFRGGERGLGCLGSVVALPRDHIPESIGTLDRHGEDRLRESVHQRAEPGGPARTAPRARLYPIVHRPRVISGLASRPQ